MIFITQLIYIKEGQENAFHQFENVAIPLIAKYNGTLLLRVRPSNDGFIETGMARPYEIHLVSFPTQQDFDNFKRDDERKKFMHLKEQSVKEAILIQGVRL
ncbi:MAG TPA: DUF1330 domain-containing protein [Chryseosolibacter sp.]|nr:DUF1330 domain-containing protein [Chryseosolibacter sp.]